MSDIQDMYEDIVSDIHGDDMTVSWSDNVISQPTVIKKAKSGHIQEVNKSKQRNIDSKCILPPNQMKNANVNQEKSNRTTSSSIENIQEPVVNKHLSQAVETAVVPLEPQHVSGEETVTTLEFQPRLQTQLLSPTSTTNENEVIPQLIMTDPTIALVPEKPSAVSSPNAAITPARSKVTCVGVQTDLTPRSLGSDPNLLNAGSDHPDQLQSECSNNVQQTIARKFKEPATSLNAVGVDQTFERQITNSHSPESNISCTMEGQVDDHLKYVKDFDKESVKDSVVHSYDGNLLKDSVQDEPSQKDTTVISEKSKPDSG